MPVHTDTSNSTCIKYFGTFRHLGLPISYTGYVGRPTVSFTNTINTDLTEVKFK